MFKFWKQIVKSLMPGSDVKRTEGILASRAL